MSVVEHIGLLNACPKYFFRRVSLCFVLFSASAVACAFSVNGYIVTHKSDTVYGRIQLSSFDLTTGGVLLDGFNEEPLYSRMLFKPSNKKRFKAYYPEMIRSFGFKYNAVEYVFRSEVVVAKSIIKSERRRHRFVRWLRNDSLGAFSRDVRLIPNPGLQSNQEQYFRINHYRLQFRKSDRAIGK